MKRNERRRSGPSGCRPAAGTPRAYATAERHRPAQYAAGLPAWRGLPSSTRSISAQLGGPLNQPTRTVYRKYVLLICLSGLVCLKYVKVVAGQWFSSRPQGLLWAFGAADEVGQGVGIGVDALLQESVEEHSAGL